MASSSLPDLRKHFLRLDERERYDEKSKTFKEISARNERSKTLPFSYKLVSKWERQTIEDAFHIFYDTTFCESPSDVLKKVTYVDELTEEQKEYIKTMKKYLHFDTDVNELHFFGSRVLSTKLKPSLEGLDTEQEEHIRKAVHKFLISVIRLTDELQNCGNIVNVCERVYTQLFCSFVDMCCLESVMSICKADQSIWKNLSGLNQVVSQPDIRLYKYGITTKSSRDADTVVSVVSVKKNRHYRETDSSDSEAERCRSIGSSVSSCSSRSSDTTEEKPRIAWIFNREVLGQHAGELLLDMHKFVQKSEDAKVYTMPGVIVKETEIYFTALEISSRHYKKLKANEELDEGDKAMVTFTLLDLDERLRKKSRTVHMRVRPADVLVY